MNANGYEDDSVANVSPEKTAFNKELMQQLQNNELN